MLLADRINAYVDQNKPWGGQDAANNVACTRCAPVLIKRSTPSPDYLAPVLPGLARGGRPFVGRPMTEWAVDGNVQPFSPTTT